MFDGERFAHWFLLCSCPERWQVVFRAELMEGEYNSAVSVLFPVT